MNLKHLIIQHLTQQTKPANFQPNSILKTITEIILEKLRKHQPDIAHDYKTPRTATITYGCKITTKNVVTQIETVVFNNFRILIMIEDTTLAITTDRLTALSITNIDLNNADIQTVLHNIIESHAPPMTFECGQPYNAFSASTTEYL